MPKVVFKALTPMAVKAAKVGIHNDGEGLRLVVKESGAKSWVFRYTMAGRTRDVGLGTASGSNPITLAEARNKCSLLRNDIKRGTDPIAQRDAESAAVALVQKEQEGIASLPTFAQAARAVHNERSETWRNVKHRAQWISTLEHYAFPLIGNTRIDQVTSPMVRDVLLQFWLERPETARRVKQRISEVLDWATAKELRTPLDLRPMARSLPRQPKQDGHHAAMPYADVPAFIDRVKNASETVGRLALLFTIYTAARTGETRHAQWCDIDLENALWNIPADKMKNTEAHIEVLSPQATAILERMKAYRLTTDECAIVFPSINGRAMSDMALLKILRDMGISGDKATVHGFRSSFKDWCSEATSYPDAASERALSHKEANKTKAAYARADFIEIRRQMMAAWGQYLNSTGATIHAIGDAKRLAG